jgi:uncharacterized protein YndB with AHSA1/START domain
MTENSDMADAALDRDEVVERIEIAASVEAVFAAISDPKQVMQWWEEEGFSKIENWNQNFVVGGRLSARWSGSKGEDYRLTGEFLVIDPPRALSYTWESNWLEPAVSKVSWRLEPTAKGTLVTVTHSGLRGYPAAIKDYSSGWPSAIRHLRDFVLQAAKKKK